MNQQDNEKILGNIRNTPITSQTKDARMKALENFNTISPKNAKIKELPYTYNSRYYYSAHTADNYKVEDIVEVINNKNIKTMRSISNYFYGTNSSYRRIIDFFANLYKYYYTLDLVNLESAMKNANGKNTIKKIYGDSLKILDSLEIESTFSFIAQRVLVDGQFFGYLWDQGNEDLVIVMLDPNFCRSRYKSSYNTNVVEFDVSFFCQYSEAERKEVFKIMPDAIKKTWNETYGNKTNKQTGKIFSNFDEARYALLPAEKSCSFNLGNQETPPIFDTIIDIINFNEYKGIEKERDTQELTKLLVQRFGLDEDGNLELLLPEIAEMHKKLAGMLNDTSGVNLLTSLADSIEMMDVQSGNDSATNNNIQKMVYPKYENAGLSSELFASTTATSLELSISNSTSFMSPLMHNFGIWLQMIVYSRVKFKNVRPVVTILPLTWYNDKRMNDLYLKNAQMGYDKILPYVASGKRQSTLVDTAILQNDILEMPELLVPLRTSFTEGFEEGGESSGPRQKGDIQQTDGDDGGITRGPGRPAKPAEERSEKTNKNRDSMNLGGE